MTPPELREQESILCYSSSHIITVIIICEDIHCQTEMEERIAFLSAKWLHGDFNNTNTKKC